MLCLTRDLLRRRERVVEFAGSRESRTGAETAKVAFERRPFFNSAKHQAKSDLGADIDVGGSEAVAERLWRDAGVRVLPGSYAAREQADGSNPGAGYIRVAMVHDRETTAEALRRIVDVLG